MCAQNDDEAGVVAAAVAALLTPGAAAGLENGVGDIGVITPYNGQVRVCVCACVHVCVCVRVCVC